MATLIEVHQRLNISIFKKSRILQFNRNILTSVLINHNPHDIAVHKKRNALISLQVKHSVIQPVQFCISVKRKMKII